VEARGTLSGVIPSAQLRVYLPASWDSVANLADAGDFRTPPRLHRYGVLGESLLDDGIRTDWEGQGYVCPRTFRIRAVEGLVAMARFFRMGEVSLVPEEVATEATEELRSLRSAGLRSHILSSPWHIPIRWFAPFVGDDREVIDESGRLSIRYRTSRPKAVDRLTKAAGVLGDGPIPRPVVEEIESLRDWMAVFPEEGLVELDYGGVSELFDREDLIDDESADDLWAALDAVAGQDWDKAGVYYGILMQRWMALVAISHSN